MYFKKGIDDAASEWAQHHAKRWLDTSGKARSQLSCSNSSVWALLGQCVHVD